MHQKLGPNLDFRRIQVGTKKLINAKSKHQYTVHRKPTVAPTLTKKQADFGKNVYDKLQTGHNYEGSKMHMSYGQLVYACMVLLQQMKYAMAQQSGNQDLGEPIRAADTHNSVLPYQNYQSTNYNRGNPSRVYRSVQRPSKGRRKVADLSNTLDQRDNYDSSGFRSSEEDLYPRFRKKDRISQNSEEEATFNNEDVGTDHTNTNGVDTDANVDTDTNDETVFLINAVSRKKRMLDTKADADHESQVLPEHFLEDDFPCASKDIDKRWLRVHNKLKGTFGSIFLRELEKYFYARFKLCLTSEHLDAVEDLTQMGNALFGDISSFFPGNGGASLAQLAGPAAQMFVDSLSNNKFTFTGRINKAELKNLANVIISIAEHHMSHPRSRMTVGDNPLIMPRDTKFIKGKLYCYIKGVPRRLHCRQWKCYARFEDGFRRVSYSVTKRKWFKGYSPQLIYKAYWRGRQVNAAYMGEHRHMSIYRVLLNVDEAYEKEFIMSRNYRLVPVEYFEGDRAERVSYDWLAKLKIEDDLPVTFNRRGILQQKGFKHPLYIADSRSLDEIKKSGFSDATKFISVPKMVGTNHGIVASSDLDGVYKRLYSKEGDYHIYMLEASDIQTVRGCSLVRNILENRENLEKFLAAPRRQNFTDWELVTNGAIYFKEIHVFRKKFPYDKLKEVTYDRDSIRKEIGDGPWAYW